MGIQTIITSMLENGIMFVATGILIWLYLRNEKNRSKRADEAEERRNIREDALEKRNSDMLEILKRQVAHQSNHLQSIDKNTEKIHSVEEDALQESIDKTVNEHLRELRNQIGACRVMLVKYHNGTYELSGLPTIRLSATNEDVMLGIEPFLPNFQNQYKGFFNWWCSCIRDQHYCAIQDINDLIVVNENAFYEFLNMRGITQMFGHAIYNKHKNVTGFIMVEFMKICTIQNDEIENCIKDKAVKISAILSFKGELKNEN